MNKFHCSQRDKLLYYHPDQKSTDLKTPWLLISFVNHWFNLIDLRKIKSEIEHLSPYDNLQIRWLYPEPPQKLNQSLYKATLDGVDFNSWTDKIIPQFTELTKQCHCQNEFTNESRCQGHLASGNLDAIIKNPVILDRLKRGPMFREATNGDSKLARQSLEQALQELTERHKNPHAHRWTRKFLQHFDRHVAELKRKDTAGEINLNKLLFPAPGSISDHQSELDSFLEKYVILPADKCRGNYFVICKNLYIKQCVTTLHAAPEYQRITLTKDSLVTKLIDQISGLVHHTHLHMLFQNETDELPYFYTLPKPHKTPIGWRPVAATHRSVLSLPQRLLTQALHLVMQTLRDFHAEEFRTTKIRKYWIVENSLDIILSLPENLVHMVSSDIDSMYQKMDQENVIKQLRTEIQRAASIVGADSFFLAIGNTSLGNSIDNGSWFDCTSGLDPVTKSLPSEKEYCSKGAIYPIENILNILEFLVKNSYVSLGNAIFHQINGIPQGGHSSGFLANLTCHSHERQWVEKFPWHSLQYLIFRYMDDFGITNAGYFQDMYRDIYPESTGINLIPNKVKPHPERLVQCKLLDTLIFVDLKGEVHVTLHDKRADYDFFVNRFPDIASTASLHQSISSFYGEIVRLFRLNTHSEGFFDNVADVAAYLIRSKNYPENELLITFSKFLDTQVFNPRLMGNKKDLELIFRYKLNQKLKT